MGSESFNFVNTVLHRRTMQKKGPFRLSKIFKRGNKTILKMNAKYSF